MARLSSVGAQKGRRNRKAADSPAGGSASSLQVRIRRAVEDDISSVIDIDHRITGIAKPEYWSDIFERYGSRRLQERFFLVAEPDKEAPDRNVLGFIVGEVRTWEFGSEPCGWVFVLSVDPEARQQRIGEQMLEALASKFRDAGITTMRTMVSRENHLHLAFFRGEGMMAGRYVQLEKSLD